MLEELHQKFVDAFIQTWSPEEAARKAGIPNSEAQKAGIDLLQNPLIQSAIQERQKAFDVAYSGMRLDKNRLLTLMMLQYEKANRLGKTKEAVEILTKVAEAQGVDIKTIKVDPIIIQINNLDENKV